MIWTVEKATGIVTIEADMDTETFDRITSVCDWIYRQYMRQDYHKYWESIEEDISERWEEIAEPIFEAIIGTDKAQEIFDYHNPPEPEPEPLPVPKDEFETVRYCRQCEKPTIYRYDEQDGIILGGSKCQECGKERRTISDIMADKNGNL